MLKLVGWCLAGVASASVAHGPDNLAVEDMAWQEMIPGVEFAPAYGDWNEEGHGKFVRFAPGTVVPMHHHTAGYEGIFISGKMVNILDEDTRVELDPGHYFQVAGGRMHGHECVSAEPCLFYTHSPAAWDIILPEG